MRELTRRSMLAENPKQELIFVELLKACAKTKDLLRGARLHADILRRGLLEKSTYIASTLISMYAKCGALAKSQQVLEELPIRDIISWNALVSGYANQGQAHEAFSCFKRMQRDGFSPNVVTFTCILKACGCIRAIDKGKQIHDEIVNRGLLEKNVTLGNALVDMYVKCGMLAKALEVIEDLPMRNVISWSTLISGYTRQGQGSQALGFFERMQGEGISPDEVTYTCILKACGLIGALDKGMQIHDEVTKQGLLEKSLVLGNSLVDMYVKCGLLMKAQQVLEELPVRDVITWSTLIAGYNRQEQGDKALGCFQRMQREDLSPNVVTLVCILNACSITRSIDKGKQIHDNIINRGLLEKHIGLGNALVDMYAKCGALEKAWRVLEELPARDVVSWNALITGYAQLEQAQEALECFKQMQWEGLSPNEITFVSVLNACGHAEATDTGKQIHEEIIDRGFLKKNLVLGTALVDMYSKCGMLAKAHQILEYLHDRDTICWNVLIAGYAQQEQDCEALMCFEQMQREAISPDGFTFVSIVKVCGNIKDIDMGKQIHDKIVTRGLLDQNIILGNGLEDMYTKCGALAEAQQVLKNLPVRDVVSWNTLISGYAQEDRGHEALTCFAQMQKEGHSPNEITFICILKACGSIGAVDKGKEIHDRIVGGRLLEKNTMLGTTVVDMYAKCGMLAKAHNVLQQLPMRDTVSWNALIAGYAQEGYCDETLNCVKQMELEGFSPNEVTFLCVLSACSHSGKLDEAQLYYENMSRKHGIPLKPEHHACMVMAFGNAGRFDKAMSMIKSMPSSENPSVWLSLLGSCRKWGNVKLGRLAFEQAIHLDSNLTAAYVLMVNIYVTAGMHEDAEKLEDMKAKTITFGKR